jgi:CDP-diacylglycerol--glycerol-3-phosphate 3-phosphatidyltransferase
VSAPNWISLARVALVPICVTLLLADIADGPRIAAAVFAVAALTDKLDGYVARTRNQVSTFGTFIDPLADKLLVSCVLIALVSMGRLEAWVAMVIIGREFAVTGLRLVVASSEVIAASWLGKLKTTAQMVAILALMLSSGDHLLTDVLVTIAVVLTIWSAADYFVRARRHLARAAVGL